MRRPMTSEEREQFSAMVRDHGDALLRVYFELYEGDPARFCAALESELVRDRMSRVQEDLFRPS